MIFETCKLSKLEKNGNLKEVCKKYKKYINSNNYINKGRVVYCFGYNKKRVLKVCPLNMKCFRNFGSKAYNIVNKMYPFVLKVKSVLYLKNGIVLFRSKRCKPLECLGIGQDNIYFILSLILCVIYMIIVNKIITDVGIHNWGRYHHNYVLFDWHGLRKEKGDDGKWWTRINRNLNESLAYYTNDVEKIINRKIDDIWVLKKSILIKILLNLYNGLYEIYKSNLREKEKIMLKKKKHIINDVK